MSKLQITSYKILYVALENDIQGLNKYRETVRTLWDCSLLTMKCMSCKFLFEWDYPLFTHSSPLYHLLLHFKTRTRVFRQFLSIVHATTWAILHIQCLKKGWLHRSSLKVEGK